MKRALLLAALALGFPASSSAGAVRITPTRIVVSGPGASALISRAPFRLRFTAPGGPGLSELRSGSTGPVVLSATADPLAPGVPAAASGQRYAPLSFLVGQATYTQYAGSVWGGDLQSGERSGTEYAARRVLSAHRIRGGVGLVLATDDPSGRTLDVTVSVRGPGALEVRAVPHPARGVVMMSDAFASTAAEGFYGFGGRHNALDQHGRALADFVEEENLPGLGTPGTAAGTLYPNGPTAAYDPQAQFVSSRGYGFLLAQPELSWFRLDSDRPNAWSVAVQAAWLDYIVAPGRPTKVLDALTAITGRQPLPPAWALGPMLDRLVRNAGETRATYTAELQNDLVQIRRDHLPLSAYRIEGWGLPGTGNDGLSLHTFVSFAAQSRIIAALRRRHIHPLAYLRPWITPGSAPDRARLTVRTATGGTYLTTGTTGQPIALLDFTNPGAVRFWEREVDRTLNLGFDGFMADFGEEVLAGMHFADGRTGTTMHNLYPVIYMRATRAALTAYARRHPGRQLWFFNRAGFSGAPGSAGYEGGNFPGDESTDWSQAAGLASLTPDMLNRALGGAYGYGTDIGGYYDYTTPPTTKELFLRWAEWAALSPVFRLHGSGRAGTHTPWTYDAQTVRAYRSLSQLHIRAEGLIRRLWTLADRTGVPPTRPLWLEFPGDRRAAAQSQEWTLGDDVLVAPVVVAGARRRPVYFPPGCWRDPQTGLTVAGPRSVRVAAPLTELPYFVRCGTDPFAA